MAGSAIAARIRDGRPPVRTPGLALRDPPRTYRVCAALAAAAALAGAAGWTLAEADDPPVRWRF
ncbi:MAG TPA: hypothetical protein VF547_06355 [Allosphingosinicella sp.]|jgi:hypothetical protein